MVPWWGTPGGRSASGSHGTGVSVATESHSGTLRGGPKRSETWRRGGFVTGICGDKMRDFMGKTWKNMGFQWLQDGSSHHLRAGQRYHFATF